MLEDNLRLIANALLFVIIVFVVLLSFGLFGYWYCARLSMKNTKTSKREQRIENKGRKMAALLEVTQLNEHDLKTKALQMTKRLLNGDTEPETKRLKTEEVPALELEPAPPLIGSNPSGKPKLTGAEFAEMKKKLRERTKANRAAPWFRLRELGENASLAVDIDDRTPLFLSDIQHLIMYTQLGIHAPYSPARWCNLEKPTKVDNTNILIIENISAYNFSANESSFKFLSEKFQHKLEMITPAAYNSDIIKDISMVPLTGTQMKKYRQQYGSLVKAVKKSDEVFDTIRGVFPMEKKSEQKAQGNSSSALPATDKFSRTQLLLSGWQMIEENFPLPIKGLMERKYAGYVLSKDEYKDVTSMSPMFALDCEMCVTTSGDNELTRVSVVNEKHEVCYDTLVKPDNKITDYLTRFSGITAKMMRNVTKKLKEVQEELRQLLPADAILIGQSLSNDLHALKMYHPYIIDTSIIFNITGERSRKTKLATLSREFLAEKIQTSNQGHCSSEDSLACMKLTQLKLKKEIYFGDAVMSTVQNEYRNYPDLGTSQYATSLMKQATRVDKKASVVGFKDVVAKYKFYADKSVENNDVNEEDTRIHCITVHSINDAMITLCEQMKDNSLNIGHIKLDESQIEKKSAKLYTLVDNWVKQFYESSVGHAMLVVIFGGKEDGNGMCFLNLKQGLPA